MVQNLTDSFWQRTIGQPWEEFIREWMNSCLLCHKKPEASGGHELTPLVFSTGPRRPQRSRTPAEWEDQIVITFQVENSVQSRQWQDTLPSGRWWMAILTMASNHHSGMVLQGLGCRHPPVTISSTVTTSGRRKWASSVEGQNSQNPREFLYERAYQVMSRKSDRSRQEDWKGTSRHVSQ